MRIIICKQGIFGGTDKLLERFEEWAMKNCHEVYVYSNNGKTDEIRIKTFDLALVPSSQLGDLWLLKKKGIYVKHLLVWIMGMGAFRDAYYSPKFSHDYLKNMLRKEADKTLDWLYKNNSIIFTDDVGAYNTFLGTDISYLENRQNNLIPIAIDVPEYNADTKVSDSDSIRMSWIGRISSDFKEIPVKHLIYDIQEWISKNKRKIELTIVGDGDAIERVKENALDVSFPIKFINNIGYDMLNKYIVDQVDILVAMGTSALDGAKCGCPTIIITPVRASDINEVSYRWIYESKGFSLGEFPGIDVATEQVRKNFESVMVEYNYDKSYNAEMCYEYSKQFDKGYVFDKLYKRELPNAIDDEMWAHIRRIYFLKSIKKYIKKILGREQ